MQPHFVIGTYRIVSLLLALPCEAVGKDVEKHKRNTWSRGRWGTNCVTITHLRHADDLVFWMMQRSANPPYQKLPEHTWAKKSKQEKQFSSASILALGTKSGKNRCSKGFESALVAKETTFIHSQRLITWTCAAKLLSTKVGTDINTHTQMKRTRVLVQIAPW